MNSILRACISSAHQLSLAKQICLPHKHTAWAFYALRSTENIKRAENKLCILFSILKLTALL